MKKLLLFAFAIFNAAAVLAQAPNTWTQRSDLGFSTHNKMLERRGAATFVIGQKAYMATGTNAAFKFSDLWEYDPTTNSWTQKANFPGSPRSEAIAFSLNGLGYLGTGNAASGPTQDFYAYDPATNSWTPRASFAGVARDGATAFSLNGKAYAGTGQAGTVFLTDFYEYNPTTDSWTAKAAFIGSPRSGAFSFALNGKGYLGGGMVGTWGGSTNTFYEYTPASNSWAQKAHAGTVARSWCASFTITDKGYVVAGRTGTGLLSEVWEYSPLNNTWASKPGLGSGSQSREGAVGFSINNIGYVTTGVGNNNTYRDDLWRFDPIYTQIWEQRATIGNMGRMLAVGFSIGAKGYLGTGFDGTCKKDIWEFDPATNSWSQKADLPGRARSGAVAFSIGNKGYLGMGRDDQFNYIDDFYEYDPIENAWKPRASYHGGWSGNSGHYRAVGFSIGKKGYVATKNSEIREFNPATNTWTYKGYFQNLGLTDAAGFSIGSKGYIGTGNTSKTFLEYDPVANTLTAKANFPGNGRNGAVAFATGSRGYMGLGYDNMSTYSDLYAYNPVNNTWTQMAYPLSPLRRDLTAFSIGNKGYIGTGRATSTFGFLRDIWEYTSADAFRDVGIMAISGPDPSGCGLGSQENITVSVFNGGSAAETAIPLGYSINGVPATPTPEVFAGPLAPNTEASFTFAAKADLSVPGVYTIKVYSLVPADARTGNDTAEIVIRNYQLPGLPSLDFETPAANLTKMRTATRLYSFVNQSSSSNFQPYTSSATGITFYTLGDTTTWETATGTTSLWNINRSYLSGAYICFSPAGGSPTDSLWLTFDLNQFYYASPAFTNFRITVNGQQVGPTYNPQAPNSPFNWKKYKVDLYQYRNLSTIEIGFESSIRGRAHSNLGGLNLVDNIRVWRRISGVMATPETLIENSLQVYPNPTSGIFTVSLPAGNHYDLTLTDLTGKALNRQRISGGLTTLKMPDSRPGLYLLKVSSAKGVMIKKLVVN